MTKEKGKQERALVERLKVAIFASPDDEQSTGVVLPVLARMIAAVATIATEDRQQLNEIEKEILDLLVRHNALERQH